MDNEKFLKILKKIKTTFLENKKVIDNCIKEEIENGNIISFENLINEIEITKKEIFEKKENKRENKQEIAIIYDGKPETTLNIIINSIYYENKTYFFAEGYELILAVLIELIKSVLMEFKIKNTIVLYQDIDIDVIAQNEDKFDNIIYIGDYFECEKIQRDFNKKILYNSYGHLKVLIDKEKYSNEYKELMKNTYKNNINVEYYNEFEEFLENITEKDTIIIYGNDDKLEEIYKKINKNNILKHSDFMKSYRFSYTQI